MYNIEKYVHRALLSLQMQTYRDFEVLLTDDGSTDRTVEICREKVEEDFRFKIIENHHQGTAAAMRNLGIRSASGKYIVFLDGDDELVPEALSVFADALKHHGELDILAAEVSSGTLSSGNFSPKETVSNLKGCHDVLSGPQVLEHFVRLHKVLCCYSCGSIYRKSFLLNHSLFQNEVFLLLEDHEWVPRVFFEAQRVASIDFVYYHYIRRADSITTGLSPRSLGDVAGVVLSLGDFALLHRNEMSAVIKRFWSNHALNAFCWHFFYPLYKDRFDKAVWNEGLSRLFGTKSSRRKVMNLFKHASLPKKIALPLILLAYCGWPWPARQYFERVYYKWS